MMVHRQLRQCPIAFTLSAKEYTSVQMGFSTSGSWPKEYTAKYVGYFVTL